MAKEIIEKEGRLYIPQIEFRTDPKISRNRGVIESGMFINIDKVELGDYSGTLIVHSGDVPIIIDLSCNYVNLGGSECFIECSYDSDKHYRDKNVSAINICIDFSNKKIITMDELKTMVVENPENRIWIYNRLNDYYANMMLEFVEETGVTDGEIPALRCPINTDNMQETLSFKDACCNCQYLQFYNESKSYPKRDWHRTRPYYEPCEILCSAKSGIATFEDLIKKLSPDEIPYPPNRL